MHFIRTMRALGPRYLALWIGQTISQFGTYIALVTLPFLIQHLQELKGEGTNLDLSVVYALETLPTVIVGLLGGALLDRWHLRPVMIATDLLRASAFFYLAGTVGEITIAAIFAFAFLIGSFTTLFDGAMYSVIPALVDRSRLADANSFVAAVQQAMFSVGVLTGGVSFTMFDGPGAGLFINGATFVVSALSLYWVGRVPHHRKPEVERGAYLKEVVNGVRYIWREPRLRITTLSAAIPNFVIGFVEATFVALAEDVFKVENKIQTGLLLGFLGVGGLIGALTAPAITRKLGLGRTLTVGMGIAGTLMLCVMFTTYGAAAFALQAGWMIGISVVNIPMVAIRQHYADESMLGTVITATRAISWGSLPVGALVGGWLGATEATIPVVARVFPLLLIGTAVWLRTTVVWSDTFGPGFDDAGRPAPESASR